MASEAMNIKALNAVILASPRSSIEQSTGRILRVRVNERVVEPLIIDIIDPHDTTMSQWKRRLAYYKKCKYDIKEYKQGGQEINSIVTVPDENGCLIMDDD
jgi:hypothetical protein